MTSEEKEKIKSITTNHHQYLVAQYFKDNMEGLNQKIIMFDLTDEDEVAITLDSEVYYMSRALLKVTLGMLGVIE
jgi:hypothetical protein